MINAVIQDNEESVGQLADGEVARLISALQNAEFTRSEKHDVARNSSFKQRSLIEIAAEAEQRKDAIETAGQVQEPDLESEITDVKNSSEVSSDDFVRHDEVIPDKHEQDAFTVDHGDNEQTSAINQKVPEPTIRDLTSNQTMEDGVSKPEAGVRGLVTNSTTDTETLEQEQGIRGLTSVPQEDVEDSEQVSLVRDLTSSSSGHDEQTTRSSFETANDAFERGKAEGISEGRQEAIAETKEAAIAEARSELAHVVNAFNKALEALLRPQTLQAETLSSSINAAILKLASERAGMQIDDMPAPFSARINALSASIEQKLVDGKVQLNKDDYAAMEPHLANFDFQFVVNPDLMRGDVALQFDGIEVRDIATNRMTSHYAEKSDNVAVVNSNSDVAMDNDAAMDDEAAMDNDAVMDKDAADEKDADLKDMLKGEESLPQADESGS